MEWITLEKNEFLTAEQLTDIYNDCLWINGRFKKLGYATYEMADCSATIDMNPKFIKQCFDRVEENLKKLHTSIYDWDENYPGVYTWGKYNVTMKARVWAWIDYLNSLFDIISDEVLRDINGDIVHDENGEMITVLINEEAN